MYKIYYINLEKAKQRQNAIESEIQNFPHMRINAFDAENMMENNDYKFKKKEGLEYKITDRNVAITLSHFKAINTFLNDDCNYGIIMEDDVSLKYINDFDELIIEILNNAPENWDVVSLHSSIDKVIKKNIECYKNNILFRKLQKNEMKSSACYIINKNSGKKIIDRYKIDDIYTFPYKFENCSSESIIHQFESYIYTEPTISIVENNLTSMGIYHVFDYKSNLVIKEYYASKKNIHLYYTIYI